jgi:hypothetical protein
VTDPDVALPEVVEVTQAFTQRLPSQRLIDLICRLEPDRPFPQIAADMPFRVIAFRRLCEMFPDRDQTSVWMHSYDVEVQVTEGDPFSPNGLTLTPPSAATGAASPAT